MKKILVLFALVSFFACRKDPIPLPQKPPPGNNKILLKDLVWHNLPSPYYHFKYGNDSRVTELSYSSGIRSYDVIYANGRVRELRSKNGANQDRLVYTHDDGEVVQITYINKQEIKYRRCFLWYNEAGKLFRMEWELKVPGVGFAQQRTILFSYYTNGNLSKRHDTWHPIPGQQDEALYIDDFDNYDNGQNVDGFLQVQLDGEHHIFLPDVRMQFNNPKKVTRTGTGINYEIDFTYQYNAGNFPVSKRGVGIFKSGPDNGQQFNNNIDFTYYP